ncbi:glycosyltransferase family 2 protein [Pedobacter sp. MR22-3]|uniref:glycosyltransferase family 2 protein n=1 Tax=Pedobacter sp. MR22-3 TaxID=2994552 RepID=UPI0022480ABE|nr:glycosyltransferase [Pedobacter sp. MR22-3]MCX2582894.1 glycosyltransferase [Pedobacter sp. MR22-3]
MIAINSPIVSICIPTYNRSTKVVNLVKDILKYQSDEIEIIVVDNCSSDDTEIKLKAIHDSRLKYSRNEENIGGTINPIKALTFANGHFALLCLDKDRLDSQSISTLIDKLRKNSTVVYGHCSINITASSNDVVYEQGIDSLLNNAYLSEHPSGMFYKVSELKKLSLIKDILDKKEKFGFYMDLLNGEMAIKGKSLVINSPIIHTETQDDCADVVSFSYDESNLFFAPQQRIIEFNRYLNSINGLKLCTADYYRLIKKVFTSGLVAATIGYKSIMANEKVCRHYNISPRTIGMRELINSGKLYLHNFFTKKIAIPYAGKLAIVAALPTRFLSKVTKIF